MAEAHTNHTGRVNLNANGADSSTWFLQIEVSLSDAPRGTMRAPAKNKRQRIQVMDGWCPLKVCRYKNADRDRVGCEDFACVSFQLRLQRSRQTALLTLPHWPRQLAPVGRAPRTGTSNTSSKNKPPDVAQTRFDAQQPLSRTLSECELCRCGPPASEDPVRTRFQKRNYFFRANSINSLWMSSTTD